MSLRPTNPRLDMMMIKYCATWLYKGQRLQFSHSICPVLCSFQVQGQLPCDFRPAVLFFRPCNLQSAPGLRANLLFADNVLGAQPSF